MSCPLQFKDVEMKTENLPEGVAVRFTSKNPETVKKIQEHFVAGKDGCAGRPHTQQEIKK